MKLITTDEQLRAHIPNIIASVKGEVPFIERLALFLDLAEDWVKTTSRVKARLMENPVADAPCGQD